MSDLKPEAESLESLLSTAIGLLMGHKDRIGYKPGSVIAKFVDECVERLKDWPYTTAAQPAQAGQVLTDAQSNEIFRESFKLIDSRMTPQQLQFVRAIESAVLARVARVPMTREQVQATVNEAGYGEWANPAQRADFINGIRHGERHHGIVGEKGGQ